MITLIDGRGQLGNTLSKIIEEDKIILDSDVVIYHTWNVEDKSELIQRECYNKFKDFVNNNKDIKIVFISTYSQTENPYNYYKQLSEAHLLTNHEKGYVVRLPTLIGKGICQKFKEEEAEAFGEMELMTVENAARNILKVSQSNSLIKSFRIKGEIASAQFVRDLILFGKKEWKK